ncbi:MAG TPA: branched-chain amino acid ABC transporter permease [Marmoricola sp.]|nr:branched-chain amino acid ABC transporter permease [Marmoricola sp.]
MLNLELLVSGLTLGAIYALVALGFHLVFKMTGIIDFAQGDKVVLGGLVGLSLVRAGLNVVLVVAIIVLALGLIVGVVYDLVAILPTQRNGEVAAIAATVGMTLLFANGHQIIWGPDAEPFPAIAGGHFHIGALQITYQSVIIWVVLAVIGGVLAYVLERTRLGRGMIASATDPMAATTVGINVSRDRSLSFALAFGLAAMAGVLVAPITLAGGGGLGTALTLKGFTGAVLGGLGSTRGVIVGSLLLGVLESQLASFLPDGNVDPVVFGILIVVLLVAPNGLFGLRRQRLA